MNNGIAENIAAVRERIAAAAAKSGRDAGGVRLVAVSKTRSAEEIQAAFEAGICDFGENKVQEITSKYDILRGFTKESTKNRNIKWHMIGHLQRNKVKYITDKVCMIHSVDSLRLAEEIDRRSSASGVTMDVLLQVNAAAEESKSGVAPGDVRQLAADILDRCDNIRMKGLMTIAPAVKEPDDARVYFSEVQSLYDAVGREFKCERLDFDCLSMGMTHDFEVAVEEGANIVRVGTGIFGPRVYAQGV
ncbi:MAG: YggS family pyridoxal phosphate-dependent enzyme [Clostridiales Family XIII bacterium]|jgi:pyridoxal phosphate enzyme (YggS family)|nr:YggS family pyridoxal phosphate-dependent enzyme [Clostridiales Family XIII bacterium]